MMRKINGLAAALVAGVLFTFAGCDNPVPIEKVEITAEVTEVAVDSTIKLTATVSPEDATDKTVTWSSSAEGIATVDSNGVVQGVAVGKAIITADAGGKTDSVEITVNAKTSEGGSGEGSGTMQAIPEFTSFKIPNAGISKNGNTVTTTVIGKNFMAQNITSETFTLASTSNSDIVKDSVITIVNDTELTVTLTIPENTGSYDVTISSGSNSLTSTFTVKDYAVGDVILKDGSKIDVTSVESTTFETSGDRVPVAVVAYINANGAAFGLGLTRSLLKWAESGTTGFITEFTGIIDSDMDGSDNWDVICSVDSSASENAATNYPAFNFAATYGTSQSYTGDFASGWYIPSILELKTIYDNKSTIQTSLDKVSGFTIEETDWSGSCWYWSSSQSSGSYYSAVRLGFSYYGSVNDYIKNDSMFVLVVHQL